MWLRSRSTRPLGRSCVGRVSSVLAADPVGTCMVAARFEAVGMDRTALGGEFFGSDDGALCFVGANLMPLVGPVESLTAMADTLADRRHTTASIVGRADLALPLWAALRPSWGQAREVRSDQPLLVCPDPPLIAPDLRVEIAGTERLSGYFPAAVAMFTEEVGVDPTAGDAGVGYRRRIGDLMGAGRAFAIFDGDEIIYKAEVGSLSRRVGLIQGVWVDPRWRGRGIAAPATAAVVRAVQRWGRLPSLYVNAHNLAARAAYRRIGFHQVGTFATVLM